MLFSLSSVFAKEGVDKENQYKLSFLEKYVGEFKGFRKEIHFHQIGQLEEQPIHFIKLEQSKDQSNHLVGSLNYDNGACIGILNEESRNEIGQSLSLSVKFTHKSREECVDGTIIKTSYRSRGNQLKIYFRWYPSEASLSRVGIYMYRLIEPVRKVLAKEEINTRHLPQKVENNALSKREKRKLERQKFRNKRLRAKQNAKKKAEAEARAKSKAIAEKKNLAPFKGLVCKGEFDNYYFTWGRPIHIHI